MPGWWTVSAGVREALWINSSTRNSDLHQHCRAHFHFTVLLERFHGVGAAHAHRRITSLADRGGIFGNLTFRELRG